MVMENNEPNGIMIYEGASGQPHIEVRIAGETVWLTIDQMADLFNKSRSTINEHILNIYAEHELVEGHTMKKIGNSDFSTKPTNYYSLEVIISVGYRVKSTQGTHFRQWATARLKEYIVKGFAMDDERLKNLGGGAYWKELLARIRDIRTSEKVFYRQILDIYATSIDYDAHADTSLVFFKKVQNKVHYAVHGHTAAEVIYTRANAEKDFMGLTTFSGSKPQLKDVTVAKNYLDEKELRALGQIVSGYLDFAERQAEREVSMKMDDWAKHLDAILTSTGEDLLLDAGSVSHEQAMDKAKTEYTKYQQKTLNDVEKSYLDTIAGIQKKAEKKIEDEK
jgi:hypothetical protein